MDTANDATLERAIGHFIGDYAPSFLSLIEALDEARLSHYSSGCGTKSITFDIFPASSNVRELMSMLTLNRTFRAKAAGLRDASAQNPYNPALDFMLYLRRWGAFAEQVMQREGASPRGVAAARAKLIMDDLLARLSEGKNGNASTMTAFAQLMRAIGVALESRARGASPQALQATELHRHNYSKALAAAQGKRLEEITGSSSQAA